MTKKTTYFAPKGKPRKKFAMQKMCWKNEKERVINRSRTSIISQIIHATQVAPKMTSRVKGKKKRFIKGPKRERKNPKS